MKTQTRTDTTTLRSTEPSRTRRGLLAAGSAVVAGLLAKQAVQPVAAGVDGDVVLGAGNSTAARTSVLNNAVASSIGPGFQGSRSPGAGSVSSSYNAGVVGFTSVSGSSGVLGQAGDNIGGIGVSGLAIGGTGVNGSGDTTGVQGQGGGDTSINLTGFPIGVRGSVPDTGYGVYGRSGVGTGVYGQGGYGVYGIGTSNGVIGQSTGGNGVYGVAYAAGTTGIVAGVYGTSNTTYGIIGSTSAPGYSGLTAITSTPGVAALAATATVNTAYAAYFTGATVVHGDFAVVGGNKSAAVPHADGSHRLVYCMESPESWFEDFGKGQLVAGKADVKLDADFASIVHADDYLVFLTPEGDSKGLFVASKSASGFAVREQQGGTSNLAFSYRLVAKRKDIAGKRLAKFDLPKINHPDPDKLPKPVTNPANKG